MFPESICDFIDERNVMESIGTLPDRIAKSLPSYKYSSKKNIWQELSTILGTDTKTSKNTWKQILKH